MNHTVKGLKNVKNTLKWRSKYFLDNESVMSLQKSSKHGLRIEEHSSCLFYPHEELSFW